MIGLVKKITDERIQVMIDPKISKKADEIQESDPLTYKNRKHVVELAINEFYLKYIKSGKKEGKKP